MVFWFGAGYKPVSGCTLHKSGYSDDRNLRVPRPWITFWLSRGPWAHSWLVRGWEYVVTQRAHSTVCCYHQGLVCWAPIPETWGFDPLSGPWVCPLSSHLTLRECLVFLFPCTLQTLPTEKATQIWHSGFLILQGHVVLGVSCLWAIAGIRLQLDMPCYIPRVPEDSPWLIRLWMCMQMHRTHACVCVCVQVDYNCVHAMRVYGGFFFSPT